MDLYERSEVILYTRLWKKYRAKRTSLCFCYWYAWFHSKSFSTEVFSSGRVCCGHTMVLFFFPPNRICVRIVLEIDVKLLIQFLAQMRPSVYWYRWGSSSSTNRQDCRLHGLMTFHRQHTDAAMPFDVLALLLAYYWCFITNHFSFFPVS